MAMSDGKVYIAWSEPTRDDLSKTDGRMTIRAAVASLVTVNKHFARCSGPLVFIAFGWTTSSLLLGRIGTACRPPLFTATKHIIDRVATSRMAAASVASVLPA